MLITGQPLNMYDASRNPSGVYSVRDDYFGKFKAFDGRILTLKKGDLVIYDNQKPICLAGILAGENESITSSTTDIAIEAAVFYHANIRRTAQRLGVSSFSQQLFAKSRNPYTIKESLYTTISLLPLFFDNYEIYSYTSFNNLSPFDVKIDFSLEKMNHRLGSSYTQEQVDTVLKNYRIKKDKNGQLIPPTDRTDLLEQCDIEEEVFRYYPAKEVTPSLEHSPITLGKLTPIQNGERKVREFLVAQGFDEIMSFTLIDQASDSKIRVFSKEPSFRIQNPMTKDHEFVRSDLLSSMLDTLNYNLSRKNEDLSLFEVSNIDTPSGSKLYLSLGIVGRRYLSGYSSAREVTFQDIKGPVMAILELLGINASRVQLTYSKNDAFHPYASADITLDKNLVGTFGQLHPKLSSTKIFLAELDLGKLLNTKGSKSKFTPYSSANFVKRDLSFKLKEGVSYQDVVRTISKVGVNILKDINLLDIFKDKQTKSTYLGITLRLSKEEGTLTDQEITAAIDKITHACVEKLGLTLRGQE